MEDIQYILKMTTSIAKGTILTYRLYPITVPWDIETGNDIDLDGTTITDVHDGRLSADLNGQWDKQVQDKGLPIYDLPKGTLCIHDLRPYVTHKQHRVYVTYDSNPLGNQYHGKEDGVLRYTTVNSIIDGQDICTPAMVLTLWDEEDYDPDHGVRSTSILNALSMQ